MSATHSYEGQQIIDFKSKHADIIAWLYGMCRDQDPRNEMAHNFRKKILNFAAVMDVEKAQASDNSKSDLLTFIKKRVGIKPSDRDETVVSNIFPHEDASASAAGWGEYLRKIVSIDLGAIEELFEQIIEGLESIYQFIVSNYQNTIRKANKLLDEMSMIIEDLKNMRNNTPSMIHLQTKLELSQSAKMQVA